MKEKIQKGLLTLRKYWSRPQKGQYVAYKEIAGFSVGGIGVKSFACLLNMMQLSATCLFTAVVYGLTPNEILILFLITNVGVGVLKTPIISWLQDKTNTPIGKFRPYLIWAGIPCVLAVIGLTWLVPIPGWMLPIGQPNKILTMVMVCFFVNVLTISQQLLNNAYMGISQTISPISAERTKIMGFSEFLGNLGPSIIQLLIPICGLVFAPTGAGAMRTPWTYRVFLPLFAILGFGLGLLVLYTSKERTSETDNIENIKANKTKENKLSFFTSLKLLSKNKEFWIVTISKFFDGFKGMLTMLLPWICAYQLSNDALQGIIQTIVSFGFTPGIVLAPLLVKLLGSRGAGVSSHLLNVVASLIMLFTFKSSPAVLLIMLFFYNFAMGPQYIVQNTIMSDGFDHQQDRDGVRIEGFAQNFQLMITTLGSVASTLVLTWILNTNNVGQVVNGVANYDLLIDASVRNSVYSQIIFFVVIASLLSALPYFFVTLNRNKMTVIRENLDKKKVISDNHLENATPEEIEIAYNNFLTEKEAERQAEITLAEKEKAQLEAKQLAEREADEKYKAELEAIRNEIITNGGTEKDAKKVIDEKIKMRKLELKAKRKAELVSIIADQKALNDRRKVYVADWKVQAQKEHKEIVTKAKSDILNAKNMYAQSMADYKKLLANKELVNNYKTEAISVKNSCKVKAKQYKLEKSEKFIAENNRFVNDKIKIDSLKKELTNLKKAYKLQTSQSSKTENKAIMKEYKRNKFDLINQIDRISFAHSSAISTISVNYSKNMDALKKEKANANKLKAMKKEIMEEKKNKIRDAKHKSQSIKLWLNVLAKESFEKLITEEALFSSIDNNSSNETIVSNQ